MWRTYQECGSNQHILWCISFTEPTWIELLSLLCDLAGRVPPKESQVVNDSPPPFLLPIQVLLGFEIGCFFSLRFLITRSIWEPLVLHIANNMLAGFLPVRESLVLQEPAVIITCTIHHDIPYLLTLIILVLFTAVVYGLFNALSFKQLQQKRRGQLSKQ